MKEFVGADSIRADGYDKVCGKALYAADYSADGMLYAVVVHSKKAHAKIVSIDTSAVSDDAYVFTHKDLKENVIPDIINDRPLLACDKVRFMGEAVAVVAADTKEKALEEAEKVSVIYEELPVYISPFDAMEEGAEPIQPNGNVAGTFENKKGNIEKGFAESDFVIEHTYYVPHQEHAYMEPDAGFSYYNGNELIVISSSQSAFNDKAIITKTLGLDPDKVRVISATVGGAFGGKDGHMTQAFGALVTVKTGKPTKIVFDRQESIAYTYKRHSAVIKVKAGFSSAGKLIAFDADTVIDTGAYTGYGYTVLGLLSEHIAGPYSIENVHIRSSLVYTNTTTSSAFRGFGAPQAAFAAESLISEAADRLGIDQLEIRKLNALRTGDIGAVGQKITASCGLREALEIVEKSDLWQNRTNEEGIGYGIAAGHLSCGFGKGITDMANVKLKKNGDIYEVYIGFTEIGQGGIGSLSAIAADALGVDISKVKMIQSDTKLTADCSSTAASRTTFIGGNAILMAAEEFKKREVSGEKNITVEKRADFPEPQEKNGIGMPHAMYTFVVQAVKVRVDKITGKIEVLDAFASTEAGKIINPMQMAGQTAGGMLQSIGYALTENIRFSTDGRLLNDSFSTYTIPTFLDAPHIESKDVDGFEPSGPYGAKGAAESPTVPTAAAINAAIFDATGKWHYRLPITAEDVLLDEKEN